MFGKRLKKIRETNNMLQSDLAKKINLSSSAVSMYELGERDPDTETLKKIADIFNVSTDYLLGRAEKPEKDIFDKPMTLAASMKNNADLSEISEHDKDIIRTLIEQMKKNK